MSKGYVGTWRKAHVYACVNQFGVITFSIQLGSMHFCALPVKDQQRNKKHYLHTLHKHFSANSWVIVYIHVTHCSALLYYVVMHTHVMMCNRIVEIWISWGSFADCVCPMAHLNVETCGPMDRSLGCCAWTSQGSLSSHLYIKLPQPLITEKCQDQMYTVIPIIHTQLAFDECSK